jgi:hypothetical protein
MAWYRERSITKEEIQTRSDPGLTLKRVLWGVAGIWMAYAVYSAIWL